jgi:RNA polymerase sigma-70 factor, ECF subfamily
MHPGEPPDQRSPTTRPNESAVEAVFRSDWGRLLSLLVARTRRLDLAEDALSEAFVRARDDWSAHGVPANPAGWLHTTAHRIIVGRLRSDAVLERKAPLIAVGQRWVDGPVGGDIEALGDERLAMLLLACHPAVSVDARSALALRLVIGTSTEEIARLFLVPVPTMAARVTRAKKKIVTAGIPLDRPVGDELQRRLDDVCRTIYLAFTAGYAPGAGPDLLRAELAGEAVELARVLLAQVPSAVIVQTLLGLLLLQHGRRDARVVDGRLVTLADQDRSRWRLDELRAGVDLILSQMPTVGLAEEWRLQGLIAVEHARALTASATDWPAIVEHYRTLELLTGSPIVRLNHAVAVGEADGPHAGLSLLVGLDALLPGNHRLHAVRAELALRSGDTAAARSHAATALTLCANEVERRHLTERFLSEP